MAKPKSTKNQLKKDAMPLYSRIATIIERKIYSGCYEPGSKLPNERELAEYFGVSIITIKGALSYLTSQGLIVRIRGKGSFVTDVVPEIKSKVYTSMNSIVKFYSESRSQVLSIDIVKVRDSRSPKSLKEFFGLSNQDDIGRVIYTRTGSDFSHYIESYLPPECARLITKKELGISGNFILTILYKRACIAVGKGTMILRADLAEPDISDILQCQSFEPVIHVQAHFWSDVSKPLLIENVYYPARFFEYQADYVLDTVDPASDTCVQTRP